MLESLKHGLEMVHVRFETVGQDEDVVEVYAYKLEVTKDHSHDSLELVRCRGDAHWQPAVTELAEWQHDRSACA
jgi:hypothetical protein